MTERGMVDSEGGGGCRCPVRALRGVVGVVRRPARVVLAVVGEGERGVVEEMREEQETRCACTLVSRAKAKARTRLEGGEEDKEAGSGKQGDKNKTSNIN